MWRAGRPELEACAAGRDELDHPARSLKAAPAPEPTIRLADLLALTLDDALGEILQVLVGGAIRHRVGHVVGTLLVGIIWDRNTTSRQLGGSFQRLAIMGSRPGQSLLALAHSR